MEQTSRRALVIWVYSLKQMKQLKQFGSIVYISKRMKYVYLYVDQDKVAEVSAKIRRLHFVRNVELSHRPDMRLDFSDILAELRAEIEEDCLTKQVSSS